MIIGIDLNGEDQYLNLMERILRIGVKQKNRTGVDTFMIPGAIIQHDLKKDGFLAITTKKLAFEAVKGELIGFLRGYTSAADFRQLGCKIWDQNANENEAWLKNKYRTGTDDLGYIYSRLWTDMPYDSHDAPEEKSAWNQIYRLIHGIKTDPTSRRLIVSAWHPEVFHQAALPPCHVLFQVLVDQENNCLHMTMYQRSCDMFLGVPFNLASYSLLLHMIAAVTGYEVGTFTWFGADCHIYENHIEQVEEQLNRSPYPLPKLRINRPNAIFEKGFVLADFEPGDFSLENYQHHPVIKAPMAV